MEYEMLGYGTYPRPLTPDLTLNLNCVTFFKRTIPVSQYSGSSRLMFQKKKKYRSDLLIFCIVVLERDLFLWRQKGGVGMRM